MAFKRAALVWDDGEMRPTHLKPSLANDVEAFLARGGIIQQVAHRKIDVKPWTLTDVQAKQLRTVIEIGQAERIAPLDMETLTLSDGFPQAFQYKGLIRYTLASWKEWKANNGAQVRMAKQRFK